MTQKNLLQSAGDGTAVPAGAVGETILSQRTYSNKLAVTSTGWQGNLTSITLTPGIWLVSGVLKIEPETTYTTGAYFSEIGITDSTLRSTANATSDYPLLTAANPSIIFSMHQTIRPVLVGSDKLIATLVTIPVVVVITSSKTYYLGGQNQVATGTAYFWGGIQAVRIA